MLAALVGSSALSSVGVAAAPPQQPEVSDVATLAPNPPHRFFTGGYRLQNFVIFDGDTGKMEGSIPSGYVSNLAIAPDNSQFYVSETYWTHGARGERQDLLSIYDAKTLALVKDGLVVDAAQAGETVQALFDHTPFYGEGGGQAGDRGEIEWSGGRGLVLDTQKQAGELYVHQIKVLEGRLAEGERVRLLVDAERRQRTRANHSAAHLAHAALRHVLGPHVSQKGQMVDAERMRFDFSHGGPLTPDELDRIEAEVNAVIRQNVPAVTRVMTPEAAIEAGAIALFGEKYGDEVRVLALGQALSGKGDYSVELCGGTHVARTGDIALFKIVSEAGVAAGIRRIEALTGEPARRWLLEQAAVAKALAEQFKVPVAELTGRIDSLQAERRALEKALSDAKRQLATGGGGGASAVEEIGGIKVIARALDGVGGKELRGVAEDFKKQIGSGVVALVGTAEGKAAVTVAVSADLVGRFSAVDLARAAVAAMGGQGAGGKPDFAQGGAPDAARAEEGLAAIRAGLAI